MIALVALRLTIGWHFFYEGCWKVDNADEFSALPFLTLSKGPFAPIFYAMAPDLDGEQRLKTAEKEITFYVPDKVRVDVKKPGDEGFTGTVPAVVTSNEIVEKKETLTVYPAYYDSVERVYQKSLARFKPEGEQLKAFQLAWGKYVSSSTADLKADAVDVAEYLSGLARFRQDQADRNDGPEQKKRQWALMMKMRQEAKGLLQGQEDAANAFCDEVYSLLTDEQKKADSMPKFIVATDLLPFGVNLPIIGQSWTNFLNFSVTWALTLIGLCLILGFCSRLAAIGGGCFLIAVLMTQPPWPTLFPAAHPETGHALIVDKNFVEMVAIFMLATLPVGRWGGLDYFVWNGFGKPVMTYLGWYVEENK
ncbi:MAG: hypothetical protein Q4D98_00560 [Planctomycetia bacterium]|nr:hypothetical protein [Planctomycetia bacterium]